MTLPWIAPWSSSERPMTKRRKRGAPSTRRLAIVLAILLVALTAVLWMLLGRRQGPPMAVERGDLGDVLRRLAAAHGAIRVLPDEPIVKEGDIFVRTWRVRFPDEAAVHIFATDVAKAAAAREASVAELEPEGLDVVHLRLDAGVEAFDLHLDTPPPRAALRPTATPVPAPPPATARPELPEGARGKLAILLDDAGQSLDLVPAAAALPVEVGVAVLPFLPHSADTAAELHRSGHEIWLHLPMEPQGYPAEKPGPGAVLVSMREGEIRSTVRSALNSVPFVVGVNNHMGSKATADLRTMTWVMQELASRGLAFIDSRTTVATVAEDAAHAQGVRTGRRLVFLDNERTPEAVRAQLDEAVFRTRHEGRAIAIGHLTRVTVQVLEDELPKLKARGADLVAPSKLVR